MMQAAWEQAFALMADQGQCGACQFVAAAMQRTPPGDDAQFRKWEALAGCLNAVADASRTKH
ncbi:hypothetical protein [Sphingomonas aerolata]|uniref:hypothetical protein n=1 Tax=Sphingomonas aerolata TaxID=185951 RepID=UPI00141AA6AA|nr:hypothetical protein [Sphingomonas aerolata]NII58979.1 hypothetical protein [Sphingomonas aerolata]